MKVRLIIASLSVVLTSCSNQQLYQFGQSVQEGQCIENAVSEEQYNQCKNAEKKAYKEYDRERKGVSKK
ncbi:hypothetical protein J3L16_08655 [Alteromonas sp. 5E99-2]|uniref:hypothetical protein n=1 Tax=Alteromonas sp. 5E99-2 TaxID=2817683 RepID=UPI001A97E76D|nr:hypothetical protein [Alteromonas sp. 5E99-2]MBO1255752.1 hypothetical protein [Alteromonas sp. 5E99-2]